jgi:hypothetical protein
MVRAFSYSSGATVRGPEKLVGAGASVVPVRDRSTAPLFCGDARSLNFYCENLSARTIHDAHSISYTFTASCLWWSVLKKAPANVQLTTIAKIAPVQTFDLVLKLNGATGVDSAVAGRDRLGFAGLCVGGGRRDADDGGSDMLHEAGEGAMECSGHCDVAASSANMNL